VCSTPAAPAAAPPPSTNSVEPWDEGSSTLSEQACDATSGAALEAGAAADQALLAAALDDLGPAIDTYLASPRDERRAASLAIASRASQSKALLDAASHLPEGAVREALAVRVRDQHPELTEAEVEAVVGVTADHVAQALRINAAQRMKDTAVRLLSAGAEGFRATAADPGRVQQLVTTLAKLEGPGATAAQLASADALRDGWGLERDGRPVTARRLSAALLARASLMQREAGAMEGRGENTLYRSLLTHDVRAVFMHEAGIHFGSWAAAQVAAVKRRGETDEQDIKTTRLVTGLLLSGVTAGLPAAISIASSAAFAAPSLLVAFEEVNDAAAGASAGSAAPDAGRVAVRHANLELTETVASIGLGQLLGPLTHRARAAEDLVDHTATNLLGHVAQHHGIHLAVGAGVEALEDERLPATGRSALELADTGT
jgi:hypothetical protein